jgi:hypothetical protein
MLHHHVRPKKTFVIAKREKGTPSFTGSTRGD